MEAVIVAGLKRPAGRMSAAAANPGLDAAMPRPAGPGDKATAAARTRLGRLEGWAAGRALAPDSLTGISLLLALCAAAWFSGGTRDDVIAGVLALCGWLLARVSARRLAAFIGGQSSGARLPEREELAGHEVTAGPAAGSCTWTSAVCATAGESAIYGGIAAGGQSAGWPGMWPLAATAIIVVALRQTIGGCGDFGPGSDAGRGPPARLSALIRRKTGQARIPRAAARVTLVAVALEVHGPRVALFAVLAAEVISICHAIAVKVPKAVPARRDVVLASRDDGAAARWAGQLVQGNLIPLPAALAGVSAAAMLAALGLANLTGAIALAPPVVMMLAAPGSGHPHDGRLDWLVPAVLQAGQYIYLAALGFAVAVPGPVVYSLCAATAVWYAGRAADPAGTLAMLRHARCDGSPRAAHAGTGIGWEGRMFAATLGAMLGMATFACVAMAAYLGVLIGRKVVIGHLLPGEGDRR